ncbi:MAG: hypothetical protein NVSMB70_01690 [Chamaesiphon sp.]
MNVDRDFIVQKVNEHMDQTLPDRIAEGVAEGVRLLVRDPDFMEAFWSQGYSQLSQSATVGVKLWLGSRILAAIAISGFGALLTWLYVRNAFK